MWANIGVCPVCIPLSNLNEDSYFILKARISANLKLDIASSKPVTIKQAVKRGVKLTNDEDW